MKNRSVRAPHRAGNGTGPVPKEAHKILIVDDEEIVQDICARSIARLGHETLVGGNGVQGLELLKKGDIAVVFTDLKMPIMDGLELLAAIKRDYPFVEVVMMTGYATIETAIQAMKNGAYDFILKPIKPDQIRLVASKCLEKIRLSRENVELRLANQKLRELEEMKDKFIAITSHELRTPVSHLKGYLGILNDDVYNELSLEEKEQCMHVILNAVNDLEEVVKEMHTLIQLESGESHLHVERIEVNELIEQIAYDYQLIAKKRNQKLTVKKHPEPLVIQADRGQIKVVLNELLQNAIKFTPDGGRIQVSTRAEEEYCVISVKDTGIGIDPSEQGNIFERFYEVQNSSYHSTSREDFMGGGLGLGLPSVRAITTAHGGGVKVKSEKDKGSEFFVYLPLVKDGQAQLKA